MELFDAAALLGVPVSEVRSVESSPAGDVVVTTDGVAYLVVPADQPDGAGRSGLMYLSAPHERYGDSFPVYTAPGADDEAAGEAVLSKAELLARAKEHGIQATGNWGEAKLAAAIAEAEAAGGQSGQPDPNAGAGADGGTDNGLVGLSRQELEDVAYVLGIEQLDQLSDDELVEAITIARGEE